MIFPRMIRVEDSSHISEARRESIILCRELGFDELRKGQVALIVTELTTNIINHATGAGGDLVFNPIEEGGAIGIDILSLDQGIGLANIGECLQDGYSTAGSAGNGLGAIRRMSSVFDIFSAPGLGVAVFSRIWKNRAPELPSLFTVGAVCRPVRGEYACGDAWAIKEKDNAIICLLADGLGHGGDAATASNLAVAIFEKQASVSPAELVRLIHVGLGATRGAAVAVAEVDLEASIVRYAGVGNISGLIISGVSSYNLVSHNGTAGVEARKIREFSYPWPENGMLVMHSDGMGTHWSLANYPGLALKAPPLIAGVLFRDHQRIHDDSTIVVVKESRPVGQL